MLCKRGLVQGTYGVGLTVARRLSSILGSTLLCVDHQPLSIPPGVAASKKSNTWYFDFTEGGDFKTSSSRIPVETCDILGERHGPSFRYLSWQKLVLTATSPETPETRCQYSRAAFQYIATQSVSNAGAGYAAHAKRSPRNTMCMSNVTNSTTTTMKKKKVMKIWGAHQDNNESRLPAYVQRDEFNHPPWGKNWWNLRGAARQQRKQRLLSSNVWGKHIPRCHGNKTTWTTIDVQWTRFTQENINNCAWNKQNDVSKPQHHNGCKTQLM